MPTTQNSHTGPHCGNCQQPAMATPENEGYSDCCNDRIHYGTPTGCPECESKDCSTCEGRGFVNGLDDPCHCHTGASLNGDRNVMRRLSYGTGS